MRKGIALASLIVLSAFIFILLNGCFQKRAPTDIYANIEIFDIATEKVVKAVQSNQKIQNEAEGYLKGISSLYIKFNPIPAKGYMIKIPLLPSVKVRNQWLNAYVYQVILIFPENEKPHIMVFYDDNRTLVFNFEGSTERLLKELDFSRSD